MNDAQEQEGKILSAEKYVEDSELSLRPKTLKEFIGQNHLKSNLEIFIKSSKKRNESLDHTLLFGPPGLGKTTIASIISREMGVNFKSTSGPMITKAGDLASILTNLEQGDVLFIDEIHRLPSTVEEVLYPAMEDFKLDLIIGEGPGARSVSIDLPKFTLVAATTRMGLLTGPLRDRFGIPLKLQFYEIDDLKKVVQRGATVLSIVLLDDAAYEIAKRSRGTPRIALRLLRRVRDFAEVQNISPINQEIANDSLTKLEVDQEGLDISDRKYIEFIATNYNGGPVGIDTIAAFLSENKDSIEEIIEPYLLQKAFIAKTSRGRVLTDKSFQHLGMKPKNTII